MGRDDDHILAMMTPAPVVIERELAVVAMMKALTVFVDDHVVALVVEVSVMMAMGCKNNVGLGGRSYRRHSQAQRQSAKKSPFSWGVLQGLNALRHINCRRTHWFRWDAESVQDHRQNSGHHQQHALHQIPKRIPLDRLPHCLTKYLCGGIQWLASNNAPSEWAETS